MDRGEQLHRRPELTVGADHDRGHVEGGEVAVDERAIADGDVIAVVDEQRQLGWVDDWADVPEPAVKIALSCAPASTTQLLDQLRRTMPSGVVATSSGRGSIDLISDDVNKGTALQWLANRLGLRVDDAVAFGDGGNDAELLAGVGHGVAMANAPDWLRARADDVAASNSEAGVQAYVERLLDDLDEVGLQAFVQ